MRIRFFGIFLVFCFSLSISMWAVPAKPVVKSVVQPDGSTLQVRLCGDENNHYYMTLEGDVVEQDKDGWYVIEKLWYLVNGNVTVENNNGFLKITAVATNSYGVPVNVTYDAAPIGSNVENVVVEGNSAIKALENNQLIIIKEGIKYNVLVNVVK